MRVAYATPPVESGVYSHFCTLRDGLAPLGVDVVGLSVARSASGPCDPKVTDPTCVCISGGGADDAKAAMAFVEWVSDTGVDAVISVADPVINSAVPFLPGSIACLARCYHNTFHSYRVSSYKCEAVDYIIATTPRQRDDLTRFRVPGEMIALVPHAVDLKRFDACRRHDASPLSIGYLGRLDEYQKGIMNLPRIAAVLAERGIPFDLRIAGSGPDSAALSRTISEGAFGSVLTLVGPVAPVDVPGFLASLDVLLFPSRFEGFGIVLIEAMAAGTVPVASRIAGVTDFIIEEGKTGFLVAIDDIGGMANAVMELGNSLALRKKMSEAATKSIQERFDSVSMCDAYLEVLRKAPRPGRKARPQPWSEFRLNPAFRASWGSRLPRSMKATLRRWAELGGRPRR